MNKPPINETCLFLLAFLFLSAQNFHQQGIDTVFQFIPGSGQNFGQSPPYFPQNIYGLPDPNATYTTPSASQDQICSLGLNGEIIVGFKNYILVDGPGIDFTVFENPFYSPYVEKIFAEPGLVSVSKDGITFYPFPCDTLTLNGCAGKTPTNGNQNPFDPFQSGGDTFDLATIGIDSIRYIRIQDWTWYLLQHPEHPFYDPTLSGFDLDAVVALHLVPLSHQSQHTFRYIYLPHKQMIQIFAPSSNQPYLIQLYNYYGSLISTTTCASSPCILPCKELSPGLYFIKVKNQVFKILIY